jgi:hypothetical protein
LLKKMRPEGVKVVMTERMSDLASLRNNRWAGQAGLRAGCLALGLSLALAASACISDVSLPACVRDQVPCGGSNAGAGNDSGIGGEGSSSLGGASEGGRAEANGGADGGNVVVSAGEAGAMDGGAGAPECATCVISPQKLTAPCAGRPYEAGLSVSGGLPPYQWQLTPAVSGWSIAVNAADSSRAMLASEETDEGATELTVMVTDARGQQQQRTLTAQARKTCYFAYTALEASGPELHLLDPLAQTASPEPLQNNSGVYDFQFSPDGRYLAYRFGAEQSHPRGKHLALVELSTLSEQVLTFGEDVVTAFAWSPDAAYLAASFTVAADTYLGAIRVPAPGSSDSPTALGATPAFAESELYWVDSRFVAYHAPLLPDLGNPGQFLPDNPAGLRTAFYAPLGPTGFGPQSMAVGSFHPGVLLQPTKLGFYMISGQAPYTTFTSLVDDPPLTGRHLQLALVGPSGNYSAYLGDDRLLQLYTAQDGYLGEIVASGMGDDTCPLPLAWAKGTERIACVADVQNANGSGKHGEIRMFELQPGSDVLKMSTLGGFCADEATEQSPASCDSLSYRYDIAKATGNARAFSPSGRWFAFVTSAEDDTYLYWADLAAATPSAKNVGAFHGHGTANKPTRLAFSPDESLVLLQHGANLVMQELTLGTHTTLSSELVADGSDCNEDFTNAPREYCAHTEGVAPVRWSPASSIVAYRTTGALTVVDVSAFPALLDFRLLAPECGVACSGQFAFQPAMSP